MVRPHNTAWFMLDCGVATVPPALPSGSEQRPMPSTTCKSTRALRLTALATWEHIGFSGECLWNRAAVTAGQRRPLNLGRERMAA
jgi:hypothetical protein